MKLLDILLYPFTKLAGGLIMRDLKKWAKTPHLFDTYPVTKRQEGMRLAFQHRYGRH